MKKLNWIYVTGAPRSGTTFIGKILSTPWAVDYIHEPFNPDCGVPGIEQRYLYMRPSGSALAEAYDPLIARIFDYRFSLRTGYYRNDSRLRKIAKRVIGSRGPVYLALAKMNPFRQAAVIKDPVGCLLTAYLADNYGVKPVILIRHPVAFVASTVRLKWDREIDLTALSSQEELMTDHFAGDDCLLGTAGASSIARAATMWRALNKVLTDQIRQHPEWIVITHEAFCRSPLETIRDLFARLDLPWSRKVEKLVTMRTSSANKPEAGLGKVQDFSRDSAKIFEARKKMLTLEQKELIYTITKDVALQYYPESTFRG